MAEEKEETVFTCGKCNQIVSGIDLKCPVCDVEPEEDKKK